MRQHSVPHFYLKRFALPPGRTRGAWQVSAYDKENGKSLSRTSTLKVAVENDFYKNWEVEGAGADQVESDLARLESYAAVMLRKVTNRGIVEPDEIPLVRDFLVHAYSRTTAYRKHAIKGAAKWIPTKGVDQVRAEGPPAWADEEFRANFDPYLDRVASRDVQIEALPSFGLRMQFPPPDGMFDGLSSGWHYVIVHVGSNRLVTSDVPVVLYRAATESYGVMPEIGLMYADELWMPLDPSHGLLLTRDFSTPRWLGDLPPAKVRAWNNALANASDRWTIWHPGSNAPSFVDLPEKN